MPPFRHFSALFVPFGLVLISATCPACRPRDFNRARPMAGSQTLPGHAVPSRTSQAASPQEIRLDEAPSHPLQERLVAQCHDGVVGKTVFSLYLSEWETSAPRLRTEAVRARHTLQAKVDRIEAPSPDLRELVASAYLSSHQGDEPDKGRLTGIELRRAVHAEVDGKGEVVLVFESEEFKYEGCIVDDFLGALKG